MIGKDPVKLLFAPIPQTNERANKPLNDKKDIKVKENDVQALYCLLTFFYHFDALRAPQRCA